VGMQVVGCINDEESVFMLCGGYQSAFGQLDRQPDFRFIRYRH